VVYSVPLSLDYKTSYLFYKSQIFNSCSLKLISQQIDNLKEDIPLYLFCSNRVNYKILNDNQFSIFLHNVRHLYRLMGIKKNSFNVLKNLVKRAIPLSKIIYQRRGRNYIPLMTFVYSPNVRTSLGIKYILNTTSNKIDGLVLKSYTDKLAINLLDILINNKSDDFIYQPDKNTDIRKEAYSKGYYLKTFKATFKNL
jgi:hypothetical protein